MRSFKPLVVVALLSCAAAGVRAQQQFTLLASIVDPATNASPEKIDAGELRVLEDGVTGKVLRVDAVDRVVKVQVLVDNGETVVLGGVFTEENSDATTKVPVLGDLPLIGYFFRTKTKDDDKSELLIFVTPKILGEGIRVN